MTTTQITDNITIRITVDGEDIDTNTGYEQLAIDHCRTWQEAAEVLASESLHGEPANGIPFKVATCEIYDGDQLIGEATATPRGIAGTGDKRPAIYVGSTHGHRAAIRRGIGLACKIDARRLVEIHECDDADTRKVIDAEGLEHDYERIFTVVDLPDLLERVRAGSGRGRPAIGPSVTVRIEPEQLAQLDAMAAERGAPLAEVLRHIVTLGLAQAASSGDDITADHGGR